MDHEAIFARRAKALAAPLQETRVEQSSLAIVVVIGAQRYAFPVEHVTRVTTVHRITPLPHVPPIVLGLGNCDGEVLAIFDAGVWCGLPRRVAEPPLSVLVLGRAGERFAFAVDALAGSLTTENLAPPPPSPHRTWLRGITADTSLVVDVAVLLRDPLFAPGNPTIAGAVDEDQ